MNAFYALVRKDLILYFSNRRSVVVSIVAPILIAAFFGSLFGGGDSTPAHVPVGITDLDNSPLSKQVVAAMKADTSLAMTELLDVEAAAQVKAGTLRASITLPKGFSAQSSQALFGGSPKPRIDLRYDPSQSMVLPLVRGLLAQHVMQTVTQSVFSGSTPAIADVREQVAADTTMPPERRRQLLEMFDDIAKVQQAQPSDPAASGSDLGSGRATLSMPFTTNETQMSSGPEPRYNSYAHSFAGMGVQFILFMGVDMAIGLLMMRRLGLWTRLRAAPLSRSTLLGSRIASTAAIALIIFSIIYAVAMTAFGVRIEGSVPGFVAVLAAFALLTASFGLLIAALGRTPEATRGLAILATLLLVMLGGAWVPSFIFPSWLQKFSLAAPTRWAIDGLDAMTWRGQPFDAAVMPIAVMLAFAALFSTLAVWRFKWKE
jgi:ABC-2 type transport system permease protein